MRVVDWKFQVACYALIVSTGEELWEKRKIAKLTTLLLEGEEEAGEAVGDVAEPPNELKKQRDCSEDQPFDDFLACGYIELYSWRNNKYPLPPSPSVNI